MNEFLSDLYKECVKRYKAATDRNFPHAKYGEARRLKSLYISNTND
jgi:hypothetical protein